MARLPVLRGNSCGKIPEHRRAASSPSPPLHRRICADALDLFLAEEPVEGTEARLVRRGRTDHRCGAGPGDRTEHQAVNTTKRAGPVRGICPLRCSAASGGFGEQPVDLVQDQLGVVSGVRQSFDYLDEPGPVDHDPVGSG